MFKRIYIMRCGNSFKIGVSNNTLERIRTLQCGNPIKIELVYESDYMQNAYQVESTLHRELDEQKIKGEWFALSDLQRVIDIISSKANKATANEMENVKRKECKIEFDRDFFFPFLKELRSEGLQAETERLRKENIELENFWKNIMGESVPNIYTNLIYRTLFGKTAKELEKEYDVKPKEYLRDCFTGTDLEKVQSMEMLVSSLINCGWGYEQIKSFISENSMKQIAG